MCGAAGARLATVGTAPFVGDRRIVNAARIVFPVLVCVRLTAAGRARGANQDASHGCDVDAGDANRERGGLRCSASN